jgi:CheY-like chemotaxis protein
MIAFFCEECGGRNTIDIDTLDKNKNNIQCQFCREWVPLPQIRNNALDKNMINTKNFKILVVDDEEAHRELLKMMLENEYSIITANGGKEALKFASEANPDLILLDVMMPDMQGDEVCRQLKADKRTRHIPVIFVTSMAEIVDEQKGLEAGAVDYITKPIQFSIAQARIAIHLELKRQSDQRKKEARRFNQSVKWLEQQVINHQSAEMEALQIKSELEQTLDVVDDIVTIQDVKKRIIRVNKAACRTFQKTADELVGKYCYEVFHGTSKLCDNCPEIADISSSVTKPVKIVNETLGKTFLMNHFPRFDDDDILTGSMHVAREVSLPLMAASFLQKKSSEKPVRVMVQRGELNRANIDNLLTVMDALSIILLNNELILKDNPDHANVDSKTARISNALIRASMLITETINEAIRPKAVPSDLERKSK